MSGPFDLDPAHWAQLRRLLDEALQQAPVRRETWIESLPAPDAALVPRLRALLAHAQALEEGHDGSATTGPSPADLAARLLHTLPKVETVQFAGLPPAAPAQRVGPYRLLHELGSGGMARVWLAERVDMLHGRRVALKLPHGAWRQAGLAERLQREREILATLEHPNIARLYDAGVADDGQPYLALEHVEGERIDVHCQREQLDVRARLRLFLQVAGAVTHAHAKLVVHRDLKPSNILVTRAGEVKLLDFGIAKLLDQGLTADTALTQQAGRALTPDYAAPEQIQGRPLGTAADIYALGVVLFELLCDVRPYRLKRDTQAALEEAILHAEVPRPSSVAPQPRRAALRGDLDTIVLQALKKDPAQRYVTVAAFADDIERHLRHLPVRAQPDRLGYRWRKYLQRNRVAVGAGTAVMLAVLGGAAAAVWQAIEASRERDAALRQEQRAAAYAEFQGAVLQDAGRSDQPLTPSQLLDRGAKMLESRAAQDDSLAAHMWYSLSRNHLMFVQTDREVDLLTRSAAAARRIGDLELLAASECSLAWSLAQRDRRRAEGHLDAGLAALARLSRPAVYAQRDCLRGQGRVMHQQGQVDQAIAILEAGLARMDSVAARTGLGHDFLMTQLADLYRAADRFKDAVVLSAQRLQQVRDAGRSGSFVELVAMNNHAGNLCRLGEYLACRDIQRQLRAWIERPEMSKSPPTTIRANIGLTLVHMGEPGEALALADEEARVAAPAGNLWAVSQANSVAARALLALARVDDAMNRLDEAERFYLKDPRAHARRLQEVASLRAQGLLARGDQAGARRGIQAVLAAVGYPTSTKATGLDEVLRLAAQIELQSGEPARALSLAADALKVASRIARDESNSADVGLAARLQAQALHALGRKSEAIASLTRAVQALGNGFGADNEQTLQAQALLRSWQPSAPRAADAREARGPGTG